MCSHIDTSGYTAIIDYRKTVYLANLGFDVHFPGRRGRGLVQAQNGDEDR